MIRPDHPVVRAMAERPDCISMLPDRAHFDEGDPGDTWQVRFGRMPLAAYRDLPEHGGW